MMRRRAVCWVAALTCGVLSLAAGRAFGWHQDGHARIVTLAVDAAADRMPPFFAEQSSLIAHCSADPDVFKESASTQLQRFERSEHYLDVELLGGAALPPVRSEFLALCAARGLEPEAVGFLPYTVAEWTQRLAMALAEHRRWPENPDIRSKACVYAGILAHYGADLCMPLHLTLYFDGKVMGADGAPLRTGIHAKVDALPGKLPDGWQALLAGAEPEPFGDLWTAVTGQVAESRSHIDAVYEMEPRLPAMGAPLGTDDDDAVVRSFAAERTRVAANFLARLYLTAWRASEHQSLPFWLQR